MEVRRKTDKMAAAIKRRLNNLFDAPRSSLDLMAPQRSRTMATTLSLLKEPFGAIKNATLFVCHLKLSQNDSVDERCYLTL